MNGASPPRDSSGARTIVLLALTLVAIAGAVAQLDAPSADAAAIDPPDLPVPAARCDVPESAASERARNAELKALANIARYPYAPADGLRALNHFAEAEHCFALALDAEAQARTVQRSKNWRARLERDYRDHLVRYARATASGQADSTKREIAFLLALLSDQEGPFLDQLRRKQLEGPASDNAEETP